MVQEKLKMEDLDPEEEFELMYADELELMNEIDLEAQGNLVKYLNIVKIITN